jgi:hypothetical protein
MAAKSPTTTITPISNNAGGDFVDEIKAQIRAKIPDLMDLLASATELNNRLLPLLPFNPRGTVLVELRKYHIKESLAGLKPKGDVFPSSKIWSPLVFVWVDQFIPPHTNVATVYDMVDYAYAEIAWRNPKSA